MKKSLIIPIIFICILLSFMDMKVYGQEKNDSLDSFNENFFTVSLSYHLINTWRLGGGYNIQRQDKHRLLFASHFIHSYISMGRFIGFDIGVQYYYGKKWIFLCGLNNTMRFNLDRNFNPNGANPAYHDLNLITPKIELGGGYSIENWDFIASVFASNYTYSKGIRFTGENKSITYRSLVISPNILITYKF